MAFQLVYTSYGSSLTKGKTGFSTVARSEKMPENLVSKIERRSHYGIERGTVFSHRILESDGVKYHLLTRTKDCGKDFDGNANFIAHHLVFTAEETEKISANPADIMACYGQWFGSFFGEPRFLREIDPTAFCKTHSSSLPAEAWRGKFGDCAYAASLGDRATIRSRVEDSAAVLKLFSEALLLRVLSSDVWEATFTTFQLPADRLSDFMWRAGVDSPDATVDFIGAKVSALPEGRAAEYARTGILTNEERHSLKVSYNIRKAHAEFVSTLETRYAPFAIGLGIGIVILAAAISYFYMF